MMEKTQPINMPQTRARTLAPQMNVPYHPPMASPLRSDSVASDLTDLSSDIPSSHEVASLNLLAEKLEKQVTYVNEGIKKNMLKMEQINKAHLNVGNLLASEARCQVDTAKFRAQLSSTNSRIAELASQPAAISDPNNRKEFDLLTENKLILERMIDRIPDQLAVIRQGLPLAIEAARDIERTYGEIVSGMAQWRQLGVHLARWKLDEGEKVELLEADMGAWGVVVDPNQK